MRAQGKTRKWRRIAALVTVAALALTALGASLVSGATAKRAGPTPVAINEAFKYRPGTLHVHAGTKVRFENQSSYTHTATDKGVFDTGHIKPGASKTVRLKHKGTYVFHCEIHDFMTGKIVVK